MKAILTDIEGTTTRLSFVHDVLFPYARQRLAAYIKANATQPDVATIIDAVRAEVKNAALSLDGVIATLEAWSAADQKIKPLKDVQGLIWEEGYKSGAYKGHLYDDAAAQLRAWQASGKKLYVYSSGSVLAQKLLFGYSTHGDLTPLFSGYFDTTAGGKRDAASYTKIAAAIGLPANDILFLSDIREELDAAKAAGMQVVGLNRDGKLAAGSHQVVSDFTAI